MNVQALKDTITKIVPDATFVEEGMPFLTAEIPGDKLHSVAEALRSTPETAMDYLFCETAIDWPEHFTMVYHLNSTEHQHTLVLKALIPDKENPSIDTVCDLWKTAEFHEREVYDLFGIAFNGHPDLRRIFLDDDWVGYPLRKDYVDEVNIVAL